MRLEQYLNEGFDIYSMLMADVDHAFLKACIQADRWFLRGSRNKVSYDGYLSIVPRSDRRPSDTNIIIHNELDSKFRKIFGLKARSEGVFVTGSVDQAGEYGIYTYAFFPIGKYKFIWSTDIKDATVYTDNIIFLYRKKIHDINYNPDPNDTDFLSYFHNKYPFDTYSDKNLAKALDSQNEVMFKCDKYYLVDIFELDYEMFKFRLSNL